jgi:hypothetical protein
MDDLVDRIEGKRDAKLLVDARSLGRLGRFEDSDEPEGSKNAKRRRFADVSGRDGEFRIRGWLAGRER